MKFLLLLILQILLGNRFVEQFNEADKSFDSMTKEQIEQMARDYSSLWAGTPIHVDDILKKDYYEAGFEAGAEWRIESVWHQPEEIPEDEKMAICMNNNKVLIGWCRGVRGWRETVKELDIIRWVYVDDLLPEEE